MMNEGRSRSSAADFVPPPISTWHATWLLIRFNPVLFFTDSILFIIVGLFPLGLGWLTGQAFDALNNQATINLDFQGIIIALVIVGIVGTAVDYGTRILDFYFSFSLTVLMRKNMMRRILELPGADALLSAPGEMVSRFSGDARNVRQLAIMALQTMMHAMIVIVGLIMMAQLAVSTTAVVLLPLLISVMLVNGVRKQIAKYRAAARGAEGDVTGFVGEMFGAVQAVKVAGAEAHVDRRFRQINEARREVALKDSLFEAFLLVVMENTNNLSIGLILLMMGDAMASGAFTVGDFALFVAILLPVSQSLTYFGQFLAVHKQATVSLKRMIDVLRGGDPKRLFKPGPIYLLEKDGWPDVPHTPKTKAHHFESLDVTNLTYLYEETRRGIKNVDLHIKRGDFVVVTGRIGSGKTTFLRALMGLLPASGDWQWNGQTINEPSDFFMPPRAAYTSQIPRLFSESLRQNILYGLPEASVDIEKAIHSAVMEKDVPELEDGLDTMVGTRGVRLSGGQVQRSAAARMFARQPEVFIFDDVSSALDVNTEQTLWQRLFALGNETYQPTCIVVSHRKPALRRADHIIVLKDGKVADQGSLDELLERCEEMQRLWQGDIGQPEESEDASQVAIN